MYEVILAVWVVRFSNKNIKFNLYPNVNVEKDTLFYTFYFILYPLKIFKRHNYHTICIPDIVVSNMIGRLIITVSITRFQLIDACK